MPTQVKTRNELIDDLTEAVSPGQPARFLVVFRLGGLEKYAGEFGNGAADGLVKLILSHLPVESGPSNFYYRPRHDELCGLISGSMFGVEAALSAAATDVSQLLELTKVSLGYGTAVLPREASDPVDALALADGRIVGVADGENVRRGSPDGVMALGLLQAA